MIRYTTVEALVALRPRVSLFRVTRSIWRFISDGIAKDVLSRAHRRRDLVSRYCDGCDGNTLVAAGEVETWLLALNWTSTKPLRRSRCLPTAELRHCYKLVSILSHARFVPEITSSNGVSGDSGRSWKREAPDGSYPMQVPLANRRSYPGVKRPRNG